MTTRRTFLDSALAFAAGLLLPRGKASALPAPVPTTPMTIGTLADLFATVECLNYRVMTVWLSEQAYQELLQTMRAEDYGEPQPGEKMWGAFITYGDGISHGTVLFTGEEMDHGGRETFIRRY